MLRIHFWECLELLVKIASRLRSMTKVKKGVIKNYELGTGQPISGMDSFPLKATGQSIDY